MLFSRELIVVHEKGLGFKNQQSSANPVTIIRYYPFLNILYALSHYYLTIIHHYTNYLQFLDYYMLLYALTNWYYYTHYLIPIIPIILFRDYYCNHTYYSTIIPIILKYYYTNYLFCSLLYVLFAFLHYYPIPFFV